jgi:hypothetical protein
MRKIGKAFGRSLKVYSSIFNLTLGFSVFIFCALVLLPLVSSYLDVGSAFLRFSSILYDMTIFQAIVFALVSLISLAFLSLFLSAIITTIKLKETLDRFRFEKVWNAFPNYVSSVFLVLLLLSVVSVMIGVSLESMMIPRPIIQLVLACVWLPFVFAPQILILEDLKVGAAMSDSWEFVRKNLNALAAYLVLGIVLLFLLALLEYSLSFVFTWEHKLLSIVIVSIGILPFLQVFATELYLMRYPLQHN